MVDSNLQRENILPSERAIAYKMKAGALKHQEQRGKSWTVEKLPQDTVESVRSIERFIRLAKQEPQLSEKVDNKEIGLTPAVELTSLTHDEQQVF